MAVDAYIQTAAAQLENAAVALKQEAEQIRADFMTYDRQVTRDINSKDAERRVHIMRSGSAPESSEAAHFAAEANRLKGEIDRLKSELEKKRSEMNEAVKGKTGQAEGLLGQAKGLYGTASNMK